MNKDDKFETVLVWIGVGIWAATILCFAIGFFMSLPEVEYLYGYCP